MADELKATPVKHDWVLSVADALKKGRGYANKLDVPVLGPAGDFLMGQAPEGLERIAYDEPLTTGKGWTTKLRPEAIDLGFMAADALPAAKATVKALRKGTEAASTAAVRKITGNAAATPHGVIDEINKMMPMPAATVWHGSPHKFDKFDSSKIGTGEGAQAYGHGLYLAESPEVAKGYKEALSRYKDLPESGPVSAAGAMLDSGVPIERIKETMNKVYGSEGYFAKKFGDQNVDIEDSIKKAQAAIAKGKEGSLYKVDLPDEHIAKMLDWDKPLSEHSAEIQELARNLDISNAIGRNKGVMQAWREGRDVGITPRGEHLYESLSGSGKYQQQASKTLHEAGIPGIQYLDGASRGAGDGTRNYVVFDDNLPKILERNGNPLVDALRKPDVVKKTKFQKAHEEAQRNAALPVEEGGLGLAPDNTAQQRAEAMGARDWFHGTERLDRLLEKDSLNPKRATSGPMPFGTDERELASTYAANKSDTSRIADDEGDMSRYFSVSPKDLGMRGTTPYSVEQSYYHLSPEKQKELLNNYYRVGYADPDEVAGDIVLHPEGTDGSIASRSHLDYVLNREARGNPLTALRNLWGESGALYGNEEALADIYRVAGYPHEISQANAPWYKANGVFTGKVMTQNPLMASNSQELMEKVVPHLENAFSRDRSRTQNWGVDMWDKNSRYTPKEWVSELKKDISAGDNSYVWTSIPDKVTAELKNLGYDSIIDVSGKGGGKESEVIIPFAPNQVRSRFAAFDPKKRDSNNLLAGVGAFVPGTGAVVDALREEPQQQ